MILGASSFARARLRCLAPFLVLVALLVSARPVVAGVGGPVTLSVLGHDLLDRRVYLLETQHGEGEALPQIYFMPLDGPRRGALVRVCSAYEGLAVHLLASECRHVAGESLDTTTFDARLAGLARRLARMTQSHDRYALHVEPLRTVTSEDPLGGAWSGVQARVRVRRRGSSESGRTVVELYRREDRRDVEIIATHRVADDSAAIVIVRYLGIPREIGYTVDRAILVPRAH